ncbi:Mobile element protein [Candidatus Enterovibrio altilux]|uniref:Mobile element protein n=1 Tax=Candidatus Enterovibrio altilux TaxID=1927128 RepID=A0A291B826_9GAMM|nr:Mobile element protein [Candidatus Enterovibrio luxaltus]
MEVKKHGTDGKQRTWQKLHLAIDINMHQMIATELSLSNVMDGEILLYLLEQTLLKINEIPGHEAYDAKQYYETVRIKRAVSFILPRRRAIFWKQGHPRHLAVSYK